MQAFLTFLPQQRKPFSRKKNKPSKAFYLPCNTAHTRLEVLSHNPDKRDPMAQVFAHLASD